MFVQIKFVNLPGPQSSGKFGSIVTTDGTKIQVPVNLLPGFRSGMSCEVATKDTTWGGNPVIVATSGPGGQPQAQGYGQGYQGAGQASGPQRPNTSFQPKVIQGGQGGPVGMPQADPSKDRNIFVCGVVQQAMSSGKFTASEILVLTQAANEAFDLIHPLPRTVTQLPPDQPQGEPMGYGDPGPEPM